MLTSGKLNFKAHVPENNAIRTPGIFVTSRKLPGIYRLVVRVSSVGGFECRAGVQRFLKNSVEMPATGILY